MSSPTLTPSLPRKASTLLALYFAQGLPFGFQAIGLPLLLREQGVSLEAIGLASLLALPWLLKAAWAPLVDRYGSRRFGRRKSWIVPMQGGLCLAAVAASRATDPHTLFALVLAMNAFAATQDIAVDGLAVSWLHEEELGPANAIQVVGYKLGMLTGGSLLVLSSERVGRSGMFLGMAACMFATLLVSLSIDERGLETGETEGHAAADGARWSSIGARLWTALAHPTTRALVVVVCTYKMGESLADAMWKPMLFDRGFAKGDIALWTGTFGMVCSLVGSAGAGILVRRAPLERALVAAAALRAAGVLGQLGIALWPAAGVSAIIAITCVEHFFGGAITTVLFALMMRATDRQIAGTHYTLFASLEVWGKMPLRALSGFIAARAGYVGLFGVAAVLCVAFSALAGKLRPRLAAPGA